DSIETRGFVVIDRLIDDASIREIISSLSESSDSSESSKRSRGGYAKRNLIEIPVIQKLAASAAMMDVARAILGSHARPVRGILFDKTPDANWLVAWHQDFSIAVKERMDVAGFGPWSVKAGVTHVQPPRGILANMVTVRLNLDDCFEDNGPLRVI